MKKRRDYYNNILEYYMVRAKSKVIEHILYYQHFSLRETQKRHCSGSIFLLLYNNGYTNRCSSIIYIRRMYSYGRIYIY